MKKARQICPLFSFFAREAEQLRLEGARRFAAKEAIYKPLSASGVEGLGWQEADIVNNGRGAPVVTLTGTCKTALERLTPDGYNPEISISLSDEPPHALAFVVLSVIGPKDQ